MAVIVICTDACCFQLDHTEVCNKEKQVSRSRGQKVKSVGDNRSDTEVFWLSLDEARQAIAEKYEFLADRYERRYPKQAR